jgi:hypothetical protein
MDSIFECRRMPDKLAHQRVRGIDNFTTEELELLQQKDETALRRANVRLEQRGLCTITLACTKRREVAQKAPSGVAILPAPTNRM